MSNEIKLSITADGSQAQAAVDKVGGALDGLAPSSERVGRKVDDLTRKLSKLGDIKRLDLARDILGVESARKVEQEIRRVEAAYKRLAESGKLSAEELQRADRARAASVEALRARIEGVGKAGEVSAAQTAAAMRTLPAQFTDVVTQLQGGANPLTILLQQGGQIKDSFGGFGPTFRALAGAITPTGAAIAGVAASVALLGGAFLAAERERLDFENGIARTGNVAGLTRGGLEDLAKSTASLAEITVGAAREVATSVAASGLFTTANAEAATRAIALYSKAVGVDAAESLKVFEGFTKDASGAALQLNERVRFLTPEVLKQVQALEQQGRNADAAAVALRAVAESLELNKPKLSDIERLLQRGKGLWSEFWEAAKGATQQADVNTALEDVERRLARLNNPNALKNRKAVDSVVTFFGGKSSIDAERRELEDARAALLRSRQLDQQVADASARRQQEEDKRNKATSRVAALLEQANAANRLSLALQQADRDFAALNGTAAEVKPEEQARIKAFLTESLADRSGIAAAQARLALAASTANAEAQARISAQDKLEAQLEARRARGLVEVEAYEEARLAIERAKLDARAELIRREIDLEGQRPASSEAERLGKQAAIAGLRSQLAANRAERDALDTRAAGDADGRALARARSDAQAFASVYQQASDAALAFERQSAQALASTISDPVKRAKAEADLAVAELERQAEVLKRLVDGQAAVLRGRATDAEAAGQADLAASLRAQADELDKAAERLERSKAQAQAGAREKAGQPIIDDFLKQQQETNLAAGFDRASQSLAQFAAGFRGLLDLQARYNAAREQAAGNAEKLAEIDRKYNVEQVKGVATLAAASKGFFKDKTGAYKALAAAEKAARAVEIAEAIRSAAIKLGLIKTETAVKVASDGTKAASESGFTLLSLAQSGARTAAKAVEAVVNSIASLPFPANLAAGAATAAAIAALGVSIFGGGGGGGGGAASLGAANNGTGTVLGDPGAQSESIANALEELADIDTTIARYSAQMASSLRNIESSIGGLAALLIQSGGLTAGAASVRTGFQQNALGSIIDKTISAFGGLFGGLDGGLIGKLGKTLGNLFGTKVSVTGQGIFAGPQGLADILAGGFEAQYFTEIQKKKKVIGVTTSKSSSVRLTDADAQFEDQVGKLLGNFVKLIEGAAAPLGRNLDDVQAKLDGFVVNVGRIDTKGLDGKALQERLTAVFSALGDNIASAALGGLSGFQKVGEGYLQTVARVATGVESAGIALKRLRIGVADYTRIANKQGDVGAELVRESILAVEGVSRLAEVIATLDGSADDIAQTFAALDDVRTSLRLLGLDASAVGFDLVQGAGGLQSLTDAVAAFEAGFLTDNERAAIKAEKLAQSFGKLGLALPKNGEDFVKLVRGIDTSTAAGRDLLGAVLSLSGGFGDLLDALKDTGRGIADEIERIKGASATGGAKTLAQAQAEFGIASAQARAGQQSAIDSLPNLSRALLDVAQSSASTAEEYAAIQASTLASLQATLEAITDPTKRLKVPGFAAGGSFAGGLRLVGENGPELEVTGPSRIFNADQTRNLLGASLNAALVEEVKALREEVRALRSEQMDGHAAIAGHTRRAADLLVRVSPDGNSIKTST